jgi:hypothetical protein
VTVAEILGQMEARRERAASVSRSFASEDSPVRKLSEARRGNTGKSVVQDDVDKVFALTLLEEIARAKDSAKRFAS